MKRTWRDTRFRREYRTDDQIRRGLMAAAEFAAVNKFPIGAKTSPYKFRGRSQRKRRTMQRRGYSMVEASTFVGAQTPDMIEAISKARRLMKQKQEAEKSAA